MQRSSFVAVKLRLVRIGKKKQPTYRLVAADSRSPRDGRFIEIVGTYAPRGKSLAEPDAVIEIDNAKAVKWLSQRGARRPNGSRSCSRQSGAWTSSPRPRRPSDRRFDPRLSGRHQHTRRDRRR